MAEHERRYIEQDAYTPEGVGAIAPAVWLWLVAFGLAFWLGVAEAVLWLV